MADRPRWRFRAGWPICDEPGCDLPVICSEDGTTWFHWVDDGDAGGPVQRHTRGEGGHEARPPDRRHLDVHSLRLTAEPRTR